jgi:hypothetical protein
VKKDILCLPLSQRTTARYHLERGPIENELLWGLENKDQSWLRDSFGHPSTVFGWEIAMTESLRERDRKRVLCSPDEKFKQQGALVVKGTVVRGPTLSLQGMVPSLDGHSRNKAPSL